MSQSDTPTTPDDSIDDDLRDAFETIAHNVDDPDVAEQFGFAPLRELDDEDGGDEQ